MKRIGGVTGILILVIIVTSAIDRNFISPYNIVNVLRWTGLFGLLSLGAAFPIITGGIDLSMGSVLAFIGCFLAHFLKVQGMPIPLALFICMVMAVAMGLMHGIIITKVRIQPFVVTLCGLFIYRGLIRFFMDDVTQGYRNQFEGLKFLAMGRIPADIWPGGNPPIFFEDWSLPMSFLITIAIGVMLAIFLNRTIYGRYILALGRNSEAARFSGINTDRMVILAYAISAACAGLAGILFSLDLNTIQPSTTGNMYELYAIAGAVVGGCSLRGGEGSIAGVIIGTAIVRVLYNAINILGIPTQLEFAIIGMVIMIGVGADEVIGRISERRKLKEMIAA